jgi:hypothetical protein
LHRRIHARFSGPSTILKTIYFLSPGYKPGLFIFLTDSIN